MADGIRIFDGSVSIVTGGASGIGRALADQLAARGSEVVLADRNGELAEKSAEEIRSVGKKATAAQVDVTDFEAVKTLVEKTAKDSGRLDFLFNNAGIAVGGEVRYHEIADWNMLLDVNVRGVVHGVQAAYKLMIEQGFGHIINTASVAGLLPSPTTVAYSASKHAVVGLSKALRLEAAPLGVRVSVLCPGVVRTPILTGGEYGRLVEEIPEEKIVDMWERARPIEPEPFARRVIRAVAKNRAIIVVPWWWRLIWLMHRFSPELGLIIGQRVYNKMRADLVG